MLIAPRAKITGDTVMMTFSESEIFIPVTAKDSAIGFTFSSAFGMK